MKGGSEKREWKKEMRNNNNNKIIIVLFMITLVEYRHCKDVKDCGKCCSWKLGVCVCVSDLHLCLWIFQQFFLFKENVNCMRLCNCFVFGGFSFIPFLFFFHSFFLMFLLFLSFNVLFVFCRIVRQHEKWIARRRIQSN